MRRHTRAIGPILFATFVLSACGDSTGPGDDLSEEEAEALAEVVIRTMIAGTEEAGGAGGGPLAVPFTFETDVNGNAPCPLGGTVGYDGSATLIGDTESDDGTFSYSMTYVHASCTARSESGIRFSVSGAPSVVASMTVVAVGNSVDMVASFSGAVEWDSEGRSGTCSISIEMTTDFDALSEVGAAAVSSSVCGRTFSQSITVG